MSMSALRNRGLLFFKLLVLSCVMWCFSLNSLLLACELSLIVAYILHFNCSFPQNFFIRLRGVANLFISNHIPMCFLIDFDMRYVDFFHF